MVAEKNAGNVQFTEAKVTILDLTLWNLSGLTCAHLAASCTYIRHAHHIWMDSFRNLTELLQHILPRPSRQPELKAVHIR
jgi:hypothetical protein